MKRRPKGSNAPWHFHVWVQARTDPARMQYRLAKAFNTPQAARQWAKRNYSEREVVIQQCDDPRCVAKKERSPNLETGT